MTKPKVSKSNGKSLDKKKVTGIMGPGGKKFPELKLMINGEMKNGNNSLSSDDDMNLAVSTYSKVNSYITHYCSSLRLKKSWLLEVKTTTNRLSKI